MSGFSIDWLNLREDADRRARNADLKQRALDWLGLGTPGSARVNAQTLLPEEVIITDLGAGTGATLRALAAPGSQKLVWRLVDHDGALLDEAIKRHGKHFRIEDHQSDLRIIGELPLGGTRLVTASALFDLVSADVVDALIKRLAGMRGGWPNGLYAALNYDGTTTWDPPHPYDELVLEAFNRDQQRDKGLGPALGPSSGDYLQRALTAAGYDVHTAASPWQLGPGDAALVEQLVEGITSAVSTGYGLEPKELQAWREFRLAHAATGQCTVGHVDVLGLAH